MTMFCPPELIDLPPAEVYREEPERGQCEQALETIADLRARLARAEEQRDEARERADKRLAKYVEMADKYDRVRAELVTRPVLPGDLATRFANAVRGWQTVDHFADELGQELAELVESWVGADTGEGE